MSKIFLLDMDGVVCDFVGAVCDLYNFKYDPLTWPLGEYGIEKVLGITDDEMWDKIDNTPFFWEDLKELPEGMKLYHELCKHGDVFFATSPSRNPNSSAGKVAWMRSRFGSKFRNYQLGPNKHLMAGNGILIDDDDNRIKKFRSCRGHAIVYPQPWNSEAGNMFRQNEYVLTWI